MSLPTEEKEDTKPKAPVVVSEIEITDKHGFYDFTLEFKDASQAKLIKGLKVNQN